MEQKDVVSQLQRFYQNNLVQYFEEVNKFFDRLSNDIQKASKELSNMSNKSQNNIQQQIQQLQQLFQQFNIDQEINRIKEMQINIEISISITKKLQRQISETEESKFEQLQYQRLNSEEKQQIKNNEAKQKLQQETEKNPKDTIALNCLGIILTDEKLYDKAIECFDKSIIQDALNECTYLYKAFALNQQKRYEEALIQCLIGLDCNEQQQNCYIYIQNILSDMSYKNLAQYFADKRIKKFSNNPLSYLEKCTFKLNIKDEINELKAQKKYH